MPEMSISQHCIILILSSFNILREHTQFEYLSLYTHFGHRWASIYKHSSQVVYIYSIGEVLQTESHNNDIFLSGAIAPGDSQLIF